MIAMAAIPFVAGDHWRASLPNLPTTKLRRSWVEPRIIAGCRAVPFVLWTRIGSDIIWLYRSLQFILETDIVRVHVPVRDHVGSLTWRQDKRCNVLFIVQVSGFLKQIRFYSLQPSSSACEGCQDMQLWEAQGSNRQRRRMIASYVPLFFNVHLNGRWQRQKE
jgi:hypothetical protein